MKVTMLKLLTLVYVSYHQMLRKKDETARCVQPTSTDPKYILHKQTLKGKVWSPDWFYVYISFSLFVN